MVLATGSWYISSITTTLEIKEVEENGKVTAGLPSYPDAQVSGNWSETQKAIFLRILQKWTNYRDPSGPRLPTLIIDHYGYVVGQEGEVRILAGYYLLNDIQQHTVLPFRKGWYAFDRSINLPPYPLPL